MINVQNVNAIGNKGGLYQDSVDHALVGIDLEHHKIHEGEHFYYSGNKALSNTDSYIVGFKTPASTTYQHMVFAATAKGACTLDVFRDGTMTASGVGALLSLAAFNSDHNSAHTATMVMYLSVTAGTGTAQTGTLVDTAVFGTTGGGPFDPQSGAFLRSGEIILKGNTNYAYRMTSAMDSNTVTWYARWYEV